MIYMGLLVGSMALKVVYKGQELYDMFAIFEQNSQWKLMGVFWFFVLFWFSLVWFRENERERVCGVEVGTREGEREP